MKKSKNLWETPKRILIVFLCFIFLFLAALACFSAAWYIRIYGRMGFSAVLFTLSTLNGVASDLVFQYIRDAAAPALAAAVIITLFLFLRPRRNLKITLFGKKTLKLYPCNRIASVIISVCLSLAMLVHAAFNSGMVSYISNLLIKGSVYEKYYVNPQSVEIKFPEEKRNLIYIYMESMEVSFLSEELGGALDVNTIPELYDLANRNINFSENENVGGFRPLDGMTWTIAGMVAQTAGIPLKTPPGIGGNDYGGDGKFLPGVSSLNDILSEEGYYQAVMFGSEAEFGGRKTYFETHQVDQIYDYNTAIEEGVIPPDYRVWWGFEDARLFPYAKNKILELAAKNQPFSFTLLTADTHHVGGYVCPDCRNDFEEQYENVYACSSRRVTDFVKWIQQQDFYENTTVILCGDHCSMDSEFFTRNTDPSYQRDVYNCIVNSAIPADNQKKRHFSTIDMFPTTLAAMGCKIQGNSLGLGVNLFSDKPTLSETYGYDAFNAELAKASDFYEKNFLEISSDSEEKS